MINESIDSIFTELIAHAKARGKTLSLEEYMKLFWALFDKEGLCLVSSKTGERVR